jgi:uncharacterized protein YndB with AHSA1/START domain
MPKDLIAHASVEVNAPAARVWDALVNPKIIRQYMFGTTVLSRWEEGSPITWKGEWKGKSYEDKGTILKMERGRLLEYSHYSPLSGLPDTPENHHTVTIELAERGRRTRVSLSQDNNANDQAREHSEQNWKTMLEGLKKLLEGQPRARLE